MPESKINPPKSWRNPERHWVSVMEHAYYKKLIEVQSCLHQAVHQFFRSEKLNAFSPPMTTGSISSPMALGSDSLPVEVELLGQKTYLADSMQFFLELGCRLHANGVYYLAVSFRGEQTDATHLQQFHHAECEIPGQLADIVRFGSRFVYHLTASLLERCPDSLAALAGSLGHLEQLVRWEGQVPHITMQEAVELLGNREPGYILNHPLGFRVLTRRGEEALVKVKGEGIGVWLTHFPSASIPFYQALDSSGEHGLNGDLLLGAHEVLGCGQRHIRDEQVHAALKAHGVPPDSYLWYAEMRQRQPLQTAGFGLGMERFLMWALQQADIRDCTVLYRDSQQACLP
jgi:asparaginyl-tRNA synthetase